MAGSNDENYYCEVANIDTFRIYLFLGQLNNLEMDYIYVGNEYIHISKKENIYKVAEPKFCEWEG